MTNQAQRVLTGIVLVPAVLGIVLFAPLPLFAVVVGLTALLTLREYLDLAGKAGLAPLPWVAYVMTALVIMRQAAAFSTPVEALLVMLVLGLVMRPSRDLAKSLSGAAATVLGVLYIGLPFALLVALRQYPSGAWLVIYVLVLTWIGDTAAYYAGRALGRHKLAPRVSPGKTWEGTVASLAAAMLLGYFLLKWFFPRVPLELNLLAAFTVNVAGQVGDLAESALKRGVGVKDSASVLPGHGGLLDRVDALLFAVPVLWYDIVLALGPYL